MGVIKVRTGLDMHVQPDWFEFLIAVPVNDAPGFQVDQIHDEITSGIGKMNYCASVKPVGVLPQYGMLDGGNTYTGVIDYLVHFDLKNDYDNLVWLLREIIKPGYVLKAFQIGVNDPEKVLAEMRKELAENVILEAEDIAEAAFQEVVGLESAKYSSLMKMDRYAEVFGEDPYSHDGHYCFESCPTVSNPRTFTYPEELAGYLMTLKLSFHGTIKGKVSTRSKKD